MGQLGFGRASAGYSFNRFHRFRFTAWTQQWIVGLCLSVEKHIPFTPNGLIIWRKEKGSQCNLSFEYYCRVVTTLPSKSLGRVHCKVQVKLVLIQIGSS
jgi:hypothetical protein